jgi:hypothetical protein
MTKRELLLELKQFHGNDNVTVAVFDKKKKVAHICDVESVYANGGPELAVNL